MTTAYSSAFPPLQSFSPWSIPNNKNVTKRHSSPVTSTTHHCPANSQFVTTPLSPPKYPSYLKHTRYASLVMEQYHHLLNKQRTYDHIETTDLRLPQYWNKNDKSRSIEVGMNGLDLSYVLGSGKAAHATQQNMAEAATVRTHFPVRAQCGVYYFEIKVNALGLDGLFAIGLCSLQHKLDVLPGHDAFSFGYHGQSGQIFKQKQAQDYGPNYSSGDVIGCGVNFATGNVFFTKNGIFLGSAFEFDTDASYYPCVGLSTPGERMTANFGQEPFLFDIVHYIKDQHVSFNQSIQSYSKDKASIDQMVASYLIHLGYTETAKSLLKNSHQLNPTKQETSVCLSDDDINMNHLRQTIMSGGCMDVALNQIQTEYPGLLEAHPDLHFELKTRKFLDFFMATPDTHPLLQPSSSCSSTPSLASSLCLSDPIAEDTDDDTLSSYSGRSRTLSISSEDEKPGFPFGHAMPLISPPMHVAASGRRLSWAAVAASPNTNLFESHCDSPLTAKRRPSLFTRQKSLDEEETGLPESSVRQAMLYGQSLQEEYQHQPKYQHRLMELFCLLTMSDPKTSTEGPLLTLAARDATVSRLIKAIRAYKHQSKTSTLEMAYKQTMTVTKELSLSGHGKASLIQFEYH
ncbi:Ran-binding protein 10 [Choanephora cucurbitarum]|uniref:Ran-binding protein 10 n=1 Tax=Choanephora cucurbitarum TaxID=101091 RepID=A0A1C7NMS9_9FUNG|nr:Ran-binding protein 10 [Choanephora cucurbitarum]